MIKELDPVVLTRGLPEHGLRAGDVGWVVMVHNEGAGYEVEFVTLAGETLSVVTVPAEGVRPVRPEEIAHVEWRNAAFRNRQIIRSGIVPSSPAS
jgi:hypothetical protein